MLICLKLYDRRALAGAVSFVKKSNVPLELSKLKIFILYIFEHNLVPLMAMPKE